MRGIRVGLAPTDTDGPKHAHQFADSLDARRIPVGLGWVDDDLVDQRARRLQRFRVTAFSQGSLQNTGLSRVDLRAARM